MVAHSMLPENPQSRNFVEMTLHEHPSIERFLERLQRYARDTYENPTFTIRKLAFDEWDPPLILQITVDMQESGFIDALHALRAWAREDRDYDENLMTLSLLPRLSLTQTTQ